jgi:hypothetical protein
MGKIVMGNDIKTRKAVKVIGRLSNYTSFGKRTAKRLTNQLDKPITQMVHTTDSALDLFSEGVKAVGFDSLPLVETTSEGALGSSASALGSSASALGSVDTRKKTLRRLAEDTLKEILESSSSPAATRASAARTLLELTGAIGRSKTDDISASDIPDFENMTAEDIDRELIMLRRKLGEV